MTEYIKKVKPSAGNWDSSIDDSKFVAGGVKKDCKFL